MIDVDHVVARYNENLGWLCEFVSVAERHQIRIKTFVYNKGSQDIEQEGLPAGSVLEILPNVGRESHTYLHHIRARTGKGDVVLFTQGNVDDCGIAYLILSIFEAYANGINSSAFSDNFARVAREHRAVRTFRIREWPPGNACEPNADDLDFGGWLKKYLSYDIGNSSVRWVVGSNFAVRRDVISKRPVEKYDELMSLLLPYGNNPEVGHFFERSWGIIFRT